MGDYTHSRDKRAYYRKDYPVLDYVHEFDIDPEKNEIYLFGREEYVHPDNEEQEPGIEWTIANRFIRNLRLLQSKCTDDEAILVHMKTNGGSWTEGMAIYDAIMACPNYVTIINYTHARSMSSIILQAADWRVMMPHAHFMFHNGTDGFEGTVKQFFSYAEWAKKTQHQMLDIYVPKCVEGEKFEGMSRGKVRAYLRRQMDQKEEVYLNAEETVDYGFADMIFGADGVYDWTKLREGWDK